MPVSLALFDLSLGPDHKLSSTGSCPNLGVSKDFSVEGKNNQNEMDV